MSTAIRRLDGDLVEVLFAKPLATDGKAAGILNEMAAAEELHLLRDEEGRIRGLETTEKSYVKFLKAMDAPRSAIESFRFALDDSKKAVRQRQREPRR